MCRNLFVWMYFHRTVVTFNVSEILCIFCWVFFSWLGAFFVGSFLVLLFLFFRLYDAYFFRFKSMSIDIICGGLALFFTLILFALSNKNVVCQSSWVQTVPEWKQGRSHGESERANFAWSFSIDERFAHAACHCFSSGTVSTQGLGWNGNWTELPHAQFTHKGCCWDWEIETSPTQYIFVKKSMLHLHTASASVHVWIWMIRDKKAPTKTAS